MKPVDFPTAREILKQRLEKGDSLPIQKKTLEYLEEFSPSSPQEVSSEKEAMLSNLRDAPEMIKKLVDKFW